MSKKEFVDVAVIGGGISGLVCAESLMKTGMDVLLIEGRKRLGGRIFSASTGLNYPAELGAEFIHGNPKEIMDSVMSRVRLNTVGESGAAVTFLTSGLAIIRLGTSTS